MHIKKKYGYDIPNSNAKPPNSKSIPPLTHLVFMLRHFYIKFASSNNGKVKLKFAVMPSTFGQNNKKYAYMNKSLHHLSFDAKLNLKSEPNELTIFGSIVTEHIDDNIIIEAVQEKSLIDTVLMLQLRVIEGVEAKKTNIKPFVYSLKDKSSKHYTNVTILYGNGESKTQMVKIEG